MFRFLVRSLYWALVNTWYARTRFFGSRLEPSVRWRGEGLRQLGPGCYIGARTAVNGHADSIVQIGARTWIGQDCELSGGQLSVGPYCSLQHRTQLHGDVRVGAGLIGAAGLYVSSGSHEFRWRPAVPIRLQDQTRLLCAGSERSSPVEIGEDCWLGYNVVVMRGVTIGRGCVVGASSVVTRDIPPYSIAVGAPARKIGERLGFTPPVEINAEEDSHLPYFYEGFDQWSADGDLYRPLRRDGGLSVIAPRFLIALAPAAFVELSLMTTRPLQISHGAITQALPIGYSKHLWPTYPDDRGRLCFTLESNDDQQLPLLGMDHGLRVYRVRNSNSVDGSGG